MRQGLGRFLPERSQLMLLVGVFVVLFAAAGFVNLAVTKSEALASRRHEQQQRDQMLDRKYALSDALGDAQQGRHIPKTALGFFQLVPPGMTVVTATEDDTTVVGILIGHICFQSS